MPTFLNRVDMGGSKITDMSNGTAATDAATLGQAGASDWLNVVTLGADPTGVTDSVTVINAAYASAVAGQVVYWPAGTYAVSTPILPPAGVITIGSAGGIGIPIGNYGIAGLPVNGAVIKPTAGFAGAAVISMTSSTTQSGQQQFHGITIDASNVTGANSIHGIQATNGVAAVKMRDVLVYGGNGKLGGNGLDLRAGANTNPDFWDISHCKFSGCLGSGVAMSGVADCFVAECEATGNTGANWNITNGNNCRFVGCKGEGSGSFYGWLLTAASGFTGQLSFTGCTSSSNHLDGFLLTGPGAGVWTFTGCRSNNDGISSGAGFTIQGSFAGTAQLTGVATVPATTTPANGLKISSASSSARIQVANSTIWGVSAALSNDGSAGSLLFDGNCVLTTGALASPSPVPQALPGAQAPGPGDWANAVTLEHADPTGAADATTKIQAAITAAAGGVAYLPPGTFLVSNLTIPSSTTLRGAGPGATTLSVKTGTTGAVIALATPASTRRACIRDLTIEGNSIGTVTGISLDNTGLSASTPGYHRLQNVIVQNMGQDSFSYGAALTEVFTAFCTSYNAGRYGFNVTTGATDSRWVSCTSGPSASHGWVVTGSSNHFVACKAYYAGYSLGGGTFSTGHGWYVVGTSVYPTMGDSWTGCEAQDCAQQGFAFVPNGGTLTALTFTGNTVDSCNAAAGTGTAGTAISTDSITYSSFIGNTAFNRSGGAGSMTYGISVANVQTGLVIGSNAFSCATGPFGYNSGFGYTLLESYLFDVSAVSTFKYSILTSALSGGGAISQGSGAPSKPNGINPTAGDIWFRTDTPSTSGQQVYICTTGGGTPVWAAISGSGSGFSNPMTAVGDLIIGGTAGAAARLAGNTTTTKNFLTQTGTGSASTAEAWGIIAAADLPAGTTSTQGALKLDGTATDIQPAGVQAAGAVGQAADAGHVHPNFASLSLYIAPSGATAETMPRNTAPNLSNVVPSSGVLCVRAIPIPAGVPVNNITFVTGGGAVEAGGTHGWYVLLDSSRVVRAVSADQTGATVWSPVDTFITLSVAGSAYTTTYSGLYYVGVCIVASTMPSIYGLTPGASQIFTPAPIVAGTSTGSLTTPPAVGTTMGAITASAGFNFYAYTS